MRRRRGPIAIGMVRKITVHLMLLKSAEKKTGSPKIVRKLSRPTKLGVEAPSHSKKAIAMVRSPGIKMIATLMASAGKRNGTSESRIRVIHLGKTPRRSERKTRSVYFE